MLVLQLDLDQTATPSFIHLLRQVTQDFGSLLEFL